MISIFFVFISSFLYFLVVIPNLGKCKQELTCQVVWRIQCLLTTEFQINPYPTAFPYGNGMVLHFYQQQESSTTKTVHRVINKGLKAYV